MITSENEQDDDEENKDKVDKLTKKLVQQRNISNTDIALTDEASSPKKGNKAVGMFAAVYDDNSRKSKFFKDIENFQFVPA